MRDLIEKLVLEQYKEDKTKTFQIQEVASEGVATALVADVGHGLHNLASNIKGWFEGLKKKRQHINDNLDNTIEWLKEEDKENPRLRLDMGSFKTWLKTSETYQFHYYYLLNDSVYNEIVTNLKKNELSELEDFFSYIVNQLNAAERMVSADMKDRKSATRMLDNIKTIKDLIVIVNKYKARVNVVFDLIEKRDRSINGFPFQMLLSGATDLKQTVKKIVNLAT